MAGDKSHRPQSVRISTVHLDEFLHRLCHAVRVAMLPPLRLTCVDGAFGEQCDACALRLPIPDGGQALE